MRCEPLVLICLLSIVLASSAHKKRNPSCNKDRETEPSSKANCQYSPKSTKMAANAADEASAAKNAQKCASEEAGQRAMDRLADKAEQAARAAEAALNGKRQLLEELHRSQCEADAVIDEVKESLARSRCNINTIIHVAANIKNHLELLQSFLDHSRLNLEKYKELAACAEREIQEKYMILMRVRKRVEELKNCMQNAKKDLCRTEEMAQRAENAAVEATYRVEMSRNIFGKAKKLKKKDLKSFVRIFKRFVKK